ncbi:MAG: FAD/NAD(P)-binding protein [Halalkalicoccus sp.]
MSPACAIVGGGIHGAHVAHRLVSETDLDPSEVAIVDPRERLLDSFREKARACGMETLRSPFVHHLEVDPFSLRDFAEVNDREDELRPTPDHPRRPTLDLFFDHARAAFAESEIADSHVRAAVRGIDRSGGRIRVETSGGPIRADRLVLAVGHGPPRRPEWARALPDEASVSHVWDDPVPVDGLSISGRVCVVGGGITAAHLAVRLAERAPVTLLARRELREAHVEADPRWINWRRMENELHPLPPGSEARLERVRAAHRTGTVPPYLMRRLEDACERGDLRVRRGEIDSARARGEEVSVRLADGAVDRFSWVVCATGFGDVANPLVERASESLGLQTGAGGLPVLDDRSLEWAGPGSDGSGVFVTGALGALTLGPLAGTIAGARRAADRLIEVHERRAPPAVAAD